MVLGGFAPEILADGVLWWVVLGGDGGADGVGGDMVMRLEVFAEVVRWVVVRCSVW
jgi:hypothetical protein